MSANHRDGFPIQRHSVDVCVVGGGMAGLCAAMASARHGAKTVLVQDRPVLGGNASSEVRMWICGAHGRNIKEAGLLEEIQLDNCRYNPYGNYPQWDSVLYAKAAFQNNLTLMLNASVCGGEMQKSNSRLAMARAWQTTTQTWHEIEAKYFIDCSGDSVLQPITDAACRWGREARDEFNESIQPETADRKTMGNSLLIQAREVDEEVPFTAPDWAYRIESESDMPNRRLRVTGHNYWWLEVGGLNDTIHDGEAIAHELRRVGLGVWDFIKNRSPHRKEAASWHLEWFGQLPGKRENRRYVGPYTLTQNDIRSGNDFTDTIAYGGWSMDDHHTAGIYYPGHPTVFHAAPSPYPIPYRCLYSQDVSNLFCAGRNISVTHAALSSTRVMATCAMLGQAAGTAAAMCVSKNISAGAVYPDHIAELQAQLMDDDSWLPGRALDLGQIVRSATVTGPGETHILLDGHERPIGDNPHGIDLALGESVAFAWDQPTPVDHLRLVMDSNLNHDKRLPCSYPRKQNPQKENWSPVPATLAKGFRVEVQTGRENDAWTTLCVEENNHQRLRRIRVDRPVTAVRVTLESTWGHDRAGFYTLAPRSPSGCGQVVDQPPTPVTTWKQVISRINPSDLDRAIGEQDQRWPKNSGA
ncbi:MAG: FAD-dependent oxidoreductase [Phycisphaera sp.]|nr:FAD-dependent oxidoreductase [Phycisphaera sp.]